MRSYSSLLNKLLHHRISLVPQFQMSNSCLMCGKSFVSQKGLNIHNQRMHQEVLGQAGERDIFADPLNDSFEDNDNDNNNEQQPGATRDREGPKVRTWDLQVIKMDDGTTIFFCRECQYVCVGNQALLAHLSMH